MIDSTYSAIYTYIGRRSSYMWMCIYTQVDNRVGSNNSSPTSHLNLSTPGLCVSVSLCLCACMPLCLCVSESLRLSVSLWMCGLVALSHHFPHIYRDTGEGKAVYLKALLQIYRALLSINRTLLQIYRALLRICRALLWICRALL